MKKLIAIAIGVALAGTATIALAGRNAGGTYSFTSVAGGYPYVSGQTISSSGVNSNMAEVATALSDSLSRSGYGGMTAPLRGADGSVSAPAYSWTSDTNTGLYRIGADNIGIALGGAKKVDLASGLTAFVDPVSFAGSTTVSGIATFNGTETHTGAAQFDAAVTFVSSVAVPTPGATTDAVNKAYADALTSISVGSITAGTGWTVGGSSRLVKSGNVVTLYLIDTTAGSGSAWTSIVTLPAGYRPGATGTGYHGVCYDQNPSVVYDCIVSVRTDGVVLATSYDNGTSLITPVFTIATSDTINFIATFIAEN